MKRALIILGLLASVVTLTGTEANAIVCARGIVRAGCVGPAGGVVVRRGVYPHAGVVARRGVVVRGGGARVIRRY
jgi:hypothetical protein